MKTIFNTDLEPMPLHNKGKWLWNGYEITTRGVNENGEGYQRKGQWQWVSSDTQNGWMVGATPQQISEFYKPDKVDENLGETLHSIIVALGVVTVVTITALFIIL